MLRTIQVWKVNISISSDETKVIFTLLILPSELGGKTSIICLVEQLIRFFHYRLQL